MQESEITFEFKNAKPVELADLSKSLFSLGDEFKRNWARDRNFFVAQPRLYVHGISTGSVIASLVPLAPDALRLVSYADSAISFIHHLKRAYDFFSGERADKPRLEKTSYQNLSNIVEPVAKDRGAQLNIGSLNIEGDLIIKLDSKKANAIQSAIRKEIGQLEEPIAGLHERVLLYWYQVRGDIKSKSGDKAIVESISKSSVKTIFADERIKSLMLLDEENPFKEAFVVDVVVETVKGKLYLYKIIKVHEKFLLAPDRVS